MNDARRTKARLDASDVIRLACDLTAAAQKAGFESAPEFKTEETESAYSNEHNVRFFGPNAARAAQYCYRWLVVNHIGNAPGPVGNGVCQVSRWSIGD